MVLLSRCDEMMCCNSKFINACPKISYKSIAQFDDTNTEFKFELPESSVNRTSSFERLFWFFFFLWFIRIILIYLKDFICKNTSTIGTQFFGWVYILHLYTGGSYYRSILLVNFGLCYWKFISTFLYLSFGVSSDCTFSIEKNH